jgi:zinc protease
MGARLEVEARAEALIIRGAVLSSQLEPFLKLVNEIVTEPSFPENEIRKLKSEVVSGIMEELGHDPSLSSRRFTTFLFRDHPYGNPVLGKRSDIEGLTRGSIAAHYEHLFRDANLLVVGTGDAKQTEIEAWSGVLGKARAGSDPKGVITKVGKTEDAPTRRLQIIDKPDRTQTQINAGQIGVRMTDPDFFPLWLGNFAFGGGSFSARMMVEIRVKRGWSYGANSYFRQGLQPRSWQLHLFPAEKDTAAALDYSLKMVEDLKSNGLKPEEFDFAQRSLVNSSGFMYNTPKKRVENKLLERTLDLPDGFMKSYGAELQKVKLSEVNGALKRFLKPDRLAISVLGTAKNLREPLAKAAGIPLNQVEVTPYSQD